MKPLLILAICLSAIVQLSAAEPNAWGKLSWGMSEAQIREAYPLAAPGYGGRLTLPGISIAGRKFTAKFDFSEGKLVQVHLTMDKETDDANDSAKLFELLTQKYGQPAEENIGTSGSRAKWRTETGTVYFAYLAQKEKPDECGIIYEGKDLQALGNL